MNVTFALTAVKQAFFKFLRRFHVIIFVLIVFGGLAIIVLMLNTIIVDSTNNDGYIPDTPNANFDQATIDRIEELKTRDQSDQPFTIPPGRSNPFAE